MTSGNSAENKADKCSASDNVHYDNSYRVADCDPSGKIAQLGYRTFVARTAITFTGLDYSSRTPNPQPTLMHATQANQDAQRGIVSEDADSKNAFPGKAHFEAGGGALGRAGA